MPRHLSAAVAIALSILALVGVVAQTGSRSVCDHTQAHSADLQTTKEELDSLKASVVDLRSKLDSMVKAAPESGGSDPSADKRLDDIQQDLGRIAGRLADIEARLASKTADPAIPPPVNDAASLRALISDVTKTPRDRVKALLQLRTSAPEERVAVVESMASLMESCEDAEIRAEVIRHMHGIDSARLKQALLFALTRDDDARVRGQAAKDLDTWRVDMEVKAALENARSSDPSERVRKFAAETLSKD